MSDTTNKSNFKTARLPRFTLGQTFATPGALATFADLSGGDSLSTLSTCLRRHHTGDWGDMDREDLQANERALRDGSRLFSAYILSSGVKIWIITEADRSSTCVLLPEEY